MIMLPTCVTVLQPAPTTAPPAPDAPESAPVVPAVPPDVPESAPVVPLAAPDVPEPEPDAAPVLAPDAAPVLAALPLSPLVATPPFELEQAARKPNVAATAAPSKYLRLMMFSWVSWMLLVGYRDAPLPWLRFEGMTIWRNRPS